LVIRNQVIRYQPEHSASIDNVRAIAPARSSGASRPSREFREVERQQLRDIGIRCVLRQFGEFMQEVHVGLELQAVPLTPADPAVRFDI
jgi:hypothetical protein